MPSKAPVHVPAHVRGKKKNKRLGANERGYTYKWQKASKAFLARPENALCKMCKAQGVVTAATLVDHIVPHKNDRQLFWEMSNWQGLCKECHDIKTLSEGSFGRDVVVNWHPDFLKPSLTPLFIICGAPGSGRRGYVRASVGFGSSIVIDLDEIIKNIMKQTDDDERSKYLNAAGRKRNAMLSDLSKPSMSVGGSAWLILSEPEAKWRQWWVDTMKPEEMIVMETSIDDCQAGIGCADHDRLVKDWWSKYTKRDGDIII